MIDLSPRAFEDLVVEALEDLPEPFASMMENVDVVVEEEPTAEQLERMPDGETLFGLYEGIPQTERDAGYSFVLPDKITIFRGPLQRTCSDPDELFEEVTVTVVHEIAHHFGISDERLDELGWS